MTNTTTSLTMSRGKLKPDDFQCIQENYVYLKENLEALDIVDYLFQYGILTLDDKEKISNKKTRSDRNEILLMALLHSGPGESFNNFLLALERNYKHVLDKLKLKHTGKKSKEMIRAIEMEDFKRCIEIVLRKERKLNDKEILSFWSQSCMPKPAHGYRFLSIEALLCTLWLDKEEYISRYYCRAKGFIGEDLKSKIEWLLDAIEFTQAECYDCWKEYVNYFYNN